MTKSRISESCGNSTFNFEKLIIFSRAAATFPILINNVRVSISLHIHKQLFYISLAKTNIVGGYDIFFEHFRIFRG